MPDVVVTVPKTFRCPPSARVGLGAWIDEGDAAGQSESGRLWSFTTFGPCPDIVPGERVYIVCEGRLRGYAPLVEMEFEDCGGGMGHVEFIRGGGAVAVTVPERIIGFRGWRYRWWGYAAELPFPEWQESEAFRKAAPLFQ